MIWPFKPVTLLDRSQPLRHAGISPPGEVTVFRSQALYRCSDPVSDRVQFSGRTSPPGLYPSAVSSVKGFEVTDNYTTIGALLLRHFLAKALANRNGTVLPYTYTTTSDELETELHQAIRMEQANFKRLEPQDITMFEGRIRPETVRKALNMLRDTQQIEMDEVRGKQTCDLTITLPFRQQTDTLPPMEDILLRHLPGRRRVYLELQYRINHGEYKPGDLIPQKLLVDGQEVPPKIRNMALSQYAKTSGRLELWREPLPQVVKRKHPRRRREKSLGHGEHLNAQQFRVLAPGAQASVNPRLVLGHARALVLYHLFKNFSDLSAHQSVPSDISFEAQWGIGKSAFSEAKGTLEKARIIDRPSKQRCLVRRVPTIEEAHQLVASTLTHPNHWVGSLIQKLSNAHKAQAFTTAGQVADMIDFTGKSGPSTRTRNVTIVTTMMNQAPIPLSFKRQMGHYLHTVLNPAVDYDQLKSTYQALDQDLLTKVSGAVMGLGLWQVPKLYEPQIKVKPVLTVMPVLGATPADPEWDLSFGLVSVQAPATFTPLKDLPVVSNPTAPVPSSNGSAFKPPVTTLDPRQYAERSLGLLSTIYPIPQWKPLLVQDHVRVKQAQLQPLEKLVEPLRQVGFEVNWPSLAV